MEAIRCDCERHKIIAERDEEGNIYIQCRGCKKKKKIEPLTKRKKEDEPPKSR